MQIIEDFCHKMVLDNAKNKSHPTGSHVTYTATDFANLYREAQSYAKAENRISEAVLVSRIRAKLPGHVRDKIEDTEDIGLQTVSTFPDLLRILARVDRTFAKRAEKSKLAALTNMSGEKGDKTPKKCSHCGKIHPNPDDGCWVKYPHLQPKPKGKGKGKQNGKGKKQKNPFGNLTKNQVNAMLAYLKESTTEVSSAEPPSISTA